MAVEYLVKEKKGNMCKIPFLLTPSKEFPDSKRSILMRDYEFPVIFFPGGWWRDSGDCGQR